MLAFSSSADFQSNPSRTDTIRFPGQYYDAETGLHYNRFRYYDPSIGRYISADPIGQYGDINLYRYAFNSPIGQTDPFGLGPPGVVGGGNSFGNPNRRSGPYYTGTDAERSVQQKTLGTGIGAIAAGAGVSAAVSGIPVPPQVKLGLGGLGLLSTLLTNDPRLNPDGDNDNDGIPDDADPDDDNDLIPDLIDPNPNISCDFAGGVCETPAQDSCQKGDTP